MFGIWGHKKAAEITYYGLHALQHRGQEGAGIATTDGENLHLHKGLDLVNDVFERDAFNKLPGNAAIGHVRYKTDGIQAVDHVQPLLFRSQSDELAICQEGNILNSRKLRTELEESGSILQTSTDSELLAHLIKRDGPKVTEESIMKALRQLVGAFSFFILTEDKLFIASDARGIRPLQIGRLGDSYVVASETCAFNLIGATYERNVAPGELITISKEGIKSQLFTEQEKRAICGMEYVYLSRPDSDINFVNVHASRKRMGRALAKESPVEADVVTGVPDSSISAAIGYAEELGLPYEIGIIKNRYIGRTFIQPSQEMREQGVKMKLSPVRGIVEGKRVVMIDDSIVRGTTSKRIVRMLKEAGALEVHVRIASPPIKNPCYYGIDMSTKEELMAANYSLEEMKDLTEADSIQFLSTEGMKNAIIDANNDSLTEGICNACMTGFYPVKENE